MIVRFLNHIVIVRNPQILDRGTHCMIYPHPLILQSHKKTKQRLFQDIVLNLIQKQNNNTRQKKTKEQRGGDLKI